jgi:hypothetical protein
MDRLRRRMTARTLVGLVVLAAALSGGLLAGGHLDAHSAADAVGTATRHAAVHEHTATVRALLPMRNNDRIAKSGLRETFAITVSALTVALGYTARRRRRLRAQHVHSSYVRFGAPRAPPALQLQP